MYVDPARRIGSAGGGGGYYYDPSSTGGIGKLGSIPLTPGGMITTPHPTLMYSHGGVTVSVIVMGRTYAIHKVITPTNKEDTKKVIAEAFEEIIRQVFADL